MAAKQVKFTFACNPVDDADLIEAIQGVSGSRRSKAIRDMLRSGIQFEGMRKLMPSGGFAGKITAPGFEIIPTEAVPINQNVQTTASLPELNYEADPDLPVSPRQTRSSTFFNPVPKPGSKK